MAVRVETTAESFGRPFEGVVDAWDMEKIILKYPTTNAGKADHNRRELHWIIITDIIFLDEAEEKQEGDVAKERWRYNPEFCCVNLDVDDLTPALFGKSYGTDEQMIVASTAPEMLEMLEKVAKGAIVKDIGSEYVTTIIPGLLPDINEVIKKARGGSEI